MFTHDRGMGNPMTTDQLNGEPISTRPASPQVVQGLEHLLREAKKGNITGYFLVGLSLEGPFDVAAGGINIKDAVTLIGQMQIVSATMASQIVQARAQHQQSGLVRANQIPDVAGLFKR